MMDDGQELAENLVDGFLPAQIDDQVDRITQSRVFKTSSQMQNFLRYVVKKKLANTTASLKQYTIAVEALGQPEDFDPETNPLVRIEAGRLRKKLYHYYAHEGKRDACVFTIPVGSYAPVFEKNKNVEVEQDVAGRLQSMGPRLLVSCFTDKSRDDTSHKLLSFFTDNIANTASQFLFIRLVSVIPHADKDISRSVIADYVREGKTDYVLTVHIHQLENTQYQLVCALMEATDNEVLWSKTYPVDQQQISSQQDQICNHISTSLMDLQQGVIHLHWARRWLQTDWSKIDERHKAIIFYRHYADNFDKESFAVAVDACQQLLKENPDDVVALVIYCEYCRREYVYAHGVIADPLATGLKCGQKAVQLKPDSHEAQYVLGQIWFHLGNHKLCKIAFEKSRRLSHHHSLVTFGTGFHLYLMEEWEAGMQLVKQAMQSNCAYPDWFHMMPFLDHYRQGEYEQALTHAQQIVSPGAFWGPLARAISYAQLGQDAEAKKEIDLLLQQSPDFGKKGAVILWRYLDSDVLYDTICSGLERAGLKLEGGQS